MFSLAYNQAIGIRDILLLLCIVGNLWSLFNGCLFSCVSFTLGVDIRTKANLSMDQGIVPGTGNVENM